MQHFVNKDILLSFIQGWTYLFKVLSWKFILLQPYVRWIKMITYSATNLPNPQDNIFFKTTENKFVVWNYHFSGRTTIYMFGFSNINCRIKCNICSKLTMKAPDVVLVSLLLKGALSGLRTFLATESLLKVMKNAFHFTLKALFVLKVLKILAWLSGHVSKLLD